MWKCGIGLIGASLMKAGDSFCQILSSSWCRRCNVWQLLIVTWDFQLFLCARVWTEIQVQESNWRKIFDETKTGWWRQWAAMQERGSDNEGAGRRNILGKSFCLPSVFTRQPHLPSTPAPASPSDLKAHLLWPGGSCECFFDLVNDDFEVNIVKAMQREKKSFLQATKQL